jgi:hypothetical protein
MRLFRCDGEHEGCGSKKSANINFTNTTTIKELIIEMSEGFKTKEIEKQIYSIIIHDKLKNVKYKIYYVHVDNLLCIHLIKNGQKTKIFENSTQGDSLSNEEFEMMHKMIESRILKE